MCLYVNPVSTSRFKNGKPNDKIRVYKCFKLSSPKNKARTYYYYTPFDGGVLKAISPLSTKSEWESTTRIAGGAIHAYTNKKRAIGLTSCLAGFWVEGYVLRKHVIAGGYGDIAAPVS